METSFCELKGKEVINVVDGKRLGRIIDIVFDTRFGRVLGIVVPAYNKSWNIFKSSDDIFIPFNCICKFGDDAILVQIYLPTQSQIGGKKGKFIRTANVERQKTNEQTQELPSTNIPLYSNSPNDNFKNPEKPEMFYEHETQKTELSSQYNQSSNPTLNQTTNYPFT